MNYSIKCFNDFAENTSKAVFMRCVGTSHDFPQLITALDSELSEKYTYNRLSQLKQLTDRSLIAKYREQCGTFCGADSEFSQVLNLYRNIYNNKNITIEQNLVISIMYWYDLYLKPSENSEKRKKLVYCGKTGYKEYFFFYYAYLLGTDVLIILPEGDINADKILLRYSQLFETGFLGKITVPEYNAEKCRKSTPITEELPASNELSYEEIAKLAESVVMIEVFDKDGELSGSGSGIAIGRDGYILTNCHVISKGYGHIVRFENDRNLYPAQIIKYHQEYDMALARIDKTIRPLPIYRGKNLVRGQKVVAIGSPMGFMNTVSDGIISGFRTVEEQLMIQFTAPISNGSSGGALLNMYGEVIGMSTASISKGQNMNLAVNCNDILMFVKNFV